MKILHVLVAFNALMIPQVFLNFTYSNNSIPFDAKDDVQQVAKAVCSEHSVMPIIKLFHYIVLNYLNHCDSVILYDGVFHKSISFQPVIKELLKSFPSTMTHGQFSAEVTEANAWTRALFHRGETRCQNYIVLTQTLEPVTKLLGYQPHNKVILVPQASQWQINNFLESRSSNAFKNLLVIADPLLQLGHLYERDKVRVDINLYTHELYADARGASAVRLVTAWRCDQLTRPGVDLFPPKILSMKGYQLRVCATQQPPYVYQKFEMDRAGDAQSLWDGLEVRLLKLISKELNFTINIQQPTKMSSSKSLAYSVLGELRDYRVDVAIAGVYVTAERQEHFGLSTVHSHDCAVFMTLSSTALPKYRAIMGPFRWEVWMCVTLAYMFAILPITFSVHHSLRLLLDEPYEIENMFWYVFGTFTNCFTFSGKKSWNSGKMTSTRMFIGTYWAFSIIVSAAYSGSIIAFIMLPVFPEVMDSAQQLVQEDFKLIVTNNSDLRQSLFNSTDEDIEKLSKGIKVVNTVEEAVSNVSKARFFTHYSFLHSREFLKHVIRSNLTKTRLGHKKDVFHLSNNCFLPMLVSMAFPKTSLLAKRFNSLLRRAAEAGFTDKLNRDVAWDQQKSDAGKLLEVSAGSRLKSRTPEDRQLTLDDTQGMFLLMGAGFGLAGLALLVECCAYLVQNPTYSCTLQHMLSIVYPANNTNQKSMQSQISSDGFDRYFGSCTQQNFFEANVSVEIENIQYFKDVKSQSVVNLKSEDKKSGEKRVSI